MTTADGHPLKAEVQDRTGRRVVVTAGVVDDTAVFRVSRPGQRPAAVLTATLRELEDLTRLGRGALTALRGQDTGHPLRAECTDPGGHRLVVTAEVQGDRAVFSVTAAAPGGGPAAVEVAATAEQVGDVVDLGAATQALLRRHGRS